ncbi:rhamnose mutarotase, partial [Lecanosticta acicola]
MPQTRRIAQIIKLKKDSIPDACNITDYSIFLDEPSRTLFAAMKYTGEDYEADMAKMRANPD